MRISFHAANADPLASADAAGSFSLVSSRDRHGLGTLRARAGTLLQRCWCHASFRCRITPAAALYLS